MSTSVLRDGNGQVFARIVGQAIVSIKGNKQIGSIDETGTPWIRGKKVKLKRRESESTPETVPATTKSPPQKRLLTKPRLIVGASVLAGVMVIAVGVMLVGRINPSNTVAGSPSTADFSSKGLEIFCDVTAEKEGDYFTNGPEVRTRIKGMISDDEELFIILTDPTKKSVVCKDAVTKKDLIRDDAGVRDWVSQPGPYVIELKSSKSNKIVARKTVEIPLEKFNKKSKKIPSKYTK